MNFFPIRERFYFTQPVKIFGGFNPEVSDQTENRQRDRLINPENIKKQNKVGHRHRSNKGTPNRKKNQIPGGEPRKDFQESFN